MVIFNPKHINKIINRVGNDIIISNKKNIQYDDWGNEYTQISSNVSTIAIVNDISGSESFETEGILVPNDKIFFFKSDEGGITNENTIIYENDEYNIVKIIPYKAENTQQQYEVWCKKM